jgi:hypothetical protein
LVRPGGADVELVDDNSSMMIRSVPSDKVLAISTT